MHKGGTYTAAYSPFCSTLLLQIHVINRVTLAATLHGVPRPLTIYVINRVIPQPLCMGSPGTGPESWDLGQFSQQYITTSY